MNERAKELLVRGAAELGVTLSSSEIGKFYSFAGELKKWNRKINLTAIKNDEEIAVKHFVDSLSLARMVKGGTLLDIGSGGGFPVIPLKIVLPRLDAVSVDAVEKKVIFQRQVGRVLNLHGFTAIHARGEELAARYAGHFDWIVSRAFSDIPSFARMALPLLKEGGRIVAMKGKGGREEADACAPALAEIGLRILGCDEFKLPVIGDGRCLIAIGRA